MLCAASAAWSKYSGTFSRGRDCGECFLERVAVDFRVERFEQRGRRFAGRLVRLPADRPVRGILVGSFCRACFGRSRSASATAMRIDDRLAARFFGPHHEAVASQHHREASAGRDAFQFVGDRLRRRESLARRRHRSRTFSVSFACNRSSTVRGGWPLVSKSIGWERSARTAVNSFSVRPKRPRGAVSDSAPSAPRRSK